MEKAGNILQQTADTVKTAGERAAATIMQSAGIATEVTKSSIANIVDAGARLPAQVSQIATEQFDQLKGLAVGRLSAEAAADAGAAVAAALRDAGDRLAAAGTDVINAPATRALALDVAAAALRAVPLPVGIGPVLADLLLCHASSDAQAAPFPPSLSVSLDEALRALGRLRDDGLLTKSEFRAQKARLLAAGLPICAPLVSTNAAGDAVAAGVSPQ